MITSKGLEKLGFDRDNDFSLQDDGAGAYIAEWKAEYDAQEYARNRQAEYPSINELIVALWENAIEERAASVIELEAKRQDVKTKYPKS